MPDDTYKPTAAIGKAASLAGRQNSIGNRAPVL